MSKITKKQQNELTQRALQRLKEIDPDGLVSPEEFVADLIKCKDVLVWKKCKTKLYDRGGKGEQRRNCHSWQKRYLFRND